MKTDKGNLMDASAQVSAKTMGSGTPRTDALIAEPNFTFRLISHARRLERELIALQADAQAMALVKKFWMVIEPPLRDKRAPNKLWYVNIPDTSDHSVQNADLNRAIVECVAKMQSAISTAVKIDSAVE